MAPDPMWGCCSGCIPEVGKGETQRWLLPGGLSEVESWQLRQLVSVYKGSGGPLWQKLQVSTAVVKASEFLQGSGESCWSLPALLFLAKGRSLTRESLLVSSSAKPKDEVVQVKCFLCFSMKLFSVFVFHRIAAASSLHSRAVLELFSSLVP